MLTSASMWPWRLTRARPGSRARPPTGRGRRGSAASYLCRALGASKVGIVRQHGRALGERHPRRAVTCEFLDVGDQHHPVFQQHGVSSRLAAPWRAQPTSPPDPSASALDGAGVVRRSRRAGGREGRARPPGLRQRGAALRPDERPDVRRRPSAVEEHAGRRPATRGRARSCSTSRAARATSPSASLRRQGERPDVTVCDINAAMLAVGRDRAARSRPAQGHQLDRPATPRHCPSPTARSTATPSPSACATSPTSTRRWREAHRVLKPGGRFCCLEFSKVTSRAARRALYDAYSSRALPLLGRVVAGDAESYRYLHESIRRFPAQRAARRAPAAGRLLQRRLAQHLDGRRARCTPAGASEWLDAPCCAPPQFLAPAAAGAEPGAARCAVPAGDHGHRAGRWSPGRACSRAARDARRPGERLAAALQEMGPSFIKLGQAMSTRADLLSEEVAADLARLQDHLPAFPGAEARRTIERRARPADRDAVLPLRRRAGGGRLDRPGAFRRRHRRPRRRRQGAAARASSSPSSATSISSTGSPSWSSAPSRASAG